MTKRINSKQKGIGILIAVLTTYLTLFFGFYFIIGGDFLFYFSYAITYAFSLGTFFVFIELCALGFVKYKEDLYARVGAIICLSTIFLITGFMISVGRMNGTIPF